MPELIFKGKEFVYNHHLAVPHRPLIPHPEKSIGEPRFDGNLIIQGDNLHALKSLLPMYAGRVDCIFIDPPYNTGNEGWCYNDNVNSPMLREWLNSNPVGIEDGLRHDKWLCMMWPRLRLLHELLANTGSFWMTIDDNEIHRARMMLDAVFSEKNFVGCACWQKKYAPSNDTVDLSAMHDYVLCYAKQREFNEQRKAVALLNRTERSEDQNSLYRNPDNDSRGLWASDNYLCNKTADQRPNLYYPIKHPKIGKDIWPSKTAVWRYSKERHEDNVRNNRVWWGLEQENEVPRYKRFLSEVRGVVQGTWWPYNEVGHSDQAKKEIKQIFSDRDNPFDTPKPVELLARILRLATDEQSIVLDSFAGSGTTAHAVLAANAKDGGDRKFILVECEDYADTLTAERVRRVINGYAFSGTQREELYREKLTFTSLKKADKLLDHVKSIKNLDGHRFDKIKAEVKDGELIVTGEKAIAERVEGLGGGFTFCTLGDAVEMDKMLTGEALPSFDQLGSLLFHMATNEAKPISSQVEDVAGCGYLGESSAFHVWLIYRDNLDFLKSRDAALTLSRAEAIVKAKPAGKRHLVFAPAKFVSQKLLNEADLPVEFAPLPWALYRVERG